MLLLKDYYIDSYKLADHYTRLVPASLRFSDKDASAQLSV